MNAVIFPYLERDVGITAGDLGLLTSAFFLFFAGCQPVLGVMLDRYGPRRVQTVLMVTAAIGGDTGALRKVGTPPGTVLARARLGRPDVWCNREQTADGQWLQSRRHRQG